jgi:integrase
VAINKRGDKYVLDWWANGKRFRKFFSTRKEAGAFETTVKQKKLDGVYVAPDKVPTFRQAAEQWLASRADRAPSTYNLYRILTARHLVSKWGERRLDKIPHAEIAAWRADLAQSGGSSRWRKPMAPTTVRAVVRTFSSILDSAIRANRLASNPVKKLERPYNRSRAGEDGEVQPDEILNAEEIRRLIEAAEPGLYRTLFILAAASGARSGELFALRWSDVVFDGQPHIRIRRSLSRAKGPDDTKLVARFGPPKTEKGTRDVPIYPAVATILKRWKLQSAPNALDLLFVRPSGEPMDRSVLVRCAFWPALKQAGLRRVKFHSLRHSYASGCLMHGSPISEVSARLGHANVGITATIYSHWFKGTDSGAASRYTETLFGGIDTK